MPIRSLTRRFPKINFQIILEHTAKLDSLMGMQTDKQTAEAIKFNISYLNSCAKTLKADVRASNKHQGLKPVFDSGFIVGINYSGNPFVQIVYTIDGIRQVSNVAI